MSVKLEVKFLNGIDIEESYQTEAEAMASIHENCESLGLTAAKTMPGTFSLFSELEGLVAVVYLNEVRG